MNDNEIELINLIRNSDTPGTALMTAAAVILGFLKQLESSEAQASVGLRELG